MKKANTLIRFIVVCALIACTVAPAFSQTINGGIINGTSGSGGGGSGGGGGSLWQYAGTPTEFLRPKLDTPMLVNPTSIDNNGLLIVTPEEVGIRTVDTSNNVTHSFTLDSNNDEASWLRDSTGTSSDCQILFNESGIRLDANKYIRMFTEGVTIGTQTPLAKLTVYDAAGGFLAHFKADTSASAGRIILENATSQILGFYRDDTFEVGRIWSNSDDTFRITSPAGFPIKIGDSSLVVTPGGDVVMDKEVTLSALAGGGVQSLLIDNDGLVSAGGTTWISINDTTIAWISDGDTFFIRKGMIENGVDGFLFHPFSDYTNFLAFLLGESKISIGADSIFLNVVQASDGIAINNVLNLTENLDPYAGAVLRSVDGNGLAQWGDAPTLLFAQYVPVGTPDTSLMEEEVTLAEYEMPASTLAPDSSTIHIYAAGELGINNNTKVIFVKFGSSTLTFLGANAVANRKTWFLEMYVTRSGASTQMITANFCAMPNAGSWDAPGCFSYTMAGTENLAAAVTIEITAFTNPGWEDDIILNHVVIEKIAP